jgi:hypothetical protein
MTWDVDSIDSINLCNGSYCKWYHLFSLLQNVGAIHWSLFNGYCYKMWVQFTGPVQWSLLKFWVQFTDPCSMSTATKLWNKMWVQFTGPLQWSLLQNVGASHWSLLNGLMNSLINSSLNHVQWINEFTQSSESIWQTRTHFVGMFLIYFSHNVFLHFMLVEFDYFYRNKYCWVQAR